jgi:hypothetical protein
VGIQVQQARLGGNTFLCAKTFLFLRIWILPVRGIVLHALV